MPRKLRTLAFNPALLVSVCAVGVLSVQACGSSGSDGPTAGAGPQAGAPPSTAGSGTAGGSAAGAGPVGGSGGGGSAEDDVLERNHHASRDGVFIQPKLTK